MCVPVGVGSVCLPGCEGRDQVVGGAGEVRGESVNMHTREEGDRAGPDRGRDTESGPRPGEEQQRQAGVGPVLQRGGGRRGRAGGAEARRGDGNRADSDPRPATPQRRTGTWSASSLLMASASCSCSSSSPLLCGQACSASGGFLLEPHCPIWWSLATCGYGALGNG